MAGGLTMPHFIILAIGFLLTSSPTDSSTGILHGSVKDGTSGELLPSSWVTFFLSNEISAPRDIQTRTGNFTIVDVPPGEYTCFVHAYGHHMLVAKNIRVNAGKVTEVDLRLREFTTRADSTDVVRPGTPGVDYRIRIYTPNDKEYR
jgi:hypothetical protein